MSYDENLPRVRVVMEDRPGYGSGTELELITDGPNKGQFVVATGDDFFAGRSAMDRAGALELAAALVLAWTGRELRLLP